MCNSSSRNLQEFRNYLSYLPESRALHDYLLIQGAFLLRRAVLVTVHRKWSANPPHRLTELGITTYDRTRTPQSQLPIPGPHAENYLRRIWSFHLVIRSTAHLDPAINSNSFHFGTTIYVSQDEALCFLHQIWHQPVDENRPDLGFRPIIYMFFGENNAISKTRKVDFNFDPSTLDTTVATLDAQNIPQQCNITRFVDTSLTYLLNQFEIPVYHPENSGNAAMYATIVAMLSTLRFELYQALDNEVAKPGQTGQSRSKSAASVVQELMDWPTPAPPFGVLVYCWRCGSTAHTIRECPNKNARCKRCEGAEEAWRKENAGTHILVMCSFR